MLKLYVVSPRIVYPFEQKKYVAYSVLVRFEGPGINDNESAVVERRYTDFLTLYNVVKAINPTVISNLNFPRKVLVGNFDPEIISMRSFTFQRLLNIISSDSSLKSHPGVTSFFCDKDINEACSLIKIGLYDLAVPMVENIFWLVSKLYTDRSHPVLRYLCLLVAVSAKSESHSAFGYASLAIQRYQAVSDVDLLKYYVPLLHTSRILSKNAGLDETLIEVHLEEMRLKGFNVNPKASLLDVVIGDIESHNATLSGSSLSQ